MKKNLASLALLKDFIHKLEMAYFLDHSVQCWENNRQLHWQWRHVYRSKRHHVGGI